MGLGELVPYETTNDLIDKKLNTLDQAKVVLDGYPREMGQAEWLLEKHREGVHKIDMAIVIDVPREESVKRLLLRGREDDTTEAIEERLKIFLGQTIPIIYFVKKEGIPTVNIDGVGTIEEVHERILKEMEKCSLV
jgi:adenylate kinase